MGTHVSPKEEMKKNTRYHSLHVYIVY
jgi:hypothetical protein